jgi:hypothetical protein
MSDSRKKVIPCLAEEEDRICDFSRNPETFVEMLAFLDKFRNIVGDGAAFIGAGTIAFPIAGRDEELAEDVLPFIERYIRAVEDDDRASMDLGQMVPQFNMDFKRSVDSPIGAPAFILDCEPSAEMIGGVVESIDGTEELIALFDVLARSLPFACIYEMQGELKLKIRAIAIEIAEAVPGIDYYDGAGEKIIIASGMEISFT